METSGGPSTSWENDLTTNMLEITSLTDLSNAQSPSSVDNENKDSSNSSSPVSSDDGKSKQATGGKSGMPRTVFSRKQLNKLEERFVQQTFLSKEERLELAEALKLTDRQVMVWFQNRRGRLKRRGPADSAFTAEKLKELNSKRPYPFLSGLLTSSHFRSPHPHPYSNMVDPTGAKMNNHPTQSYHGYSQLTTMDTMPYQSGFFSTNANGCRDNTMQHYGGSKAHTMQRPCYSMNSLFTSPPEPLAPNAMVSDQASSKPVMMTSSAKNSYTQINNMNVNMQQNTNYFNIGGQLGNYQSNAIPTQTSFYSNRSPPFAQGNYTRPNAPVNYEKSPPTSLSNSSTQGATNQIKYESISPPSSAPRNLSPESLQTPAGWYQPVPGDYSIAHGYQAHTPQHASTTHVSAQSTPVQSPETSPPCAYLDRPATERMVSSNVTVNFNNFGNSHIGIDAPIDLPLSFDFPDITVQQNQTQCVQQQSFANYA